MVAVRNEATAEFGQYLAQGCTSCHRAGFSGGAIPGAPPNWREAANITQNEATSWSQEDFFTAIRRSVQSDSSEIDPMMPCRILAK